MLRVSAQKTGREADLNLINGEDDAGQGDIEFAYELAGFAEALVGRDEAELAKARAALLAAAGPAVLVDTAGVAANFQRMVRIADSTGIPIDQHNYNPMGNGIREELKLSRFHSAQNSAGGEAAAT